MPSSLRVLNRSPWRAGSSSSTVLRRSIRDLDTGEPASNRPEPIALTGRSSIRLDTAAASRISRSPMRVIEPTLPVNSGLWTSRAVTESAKASAVASSWLATAGSTGTTVAAWSGPTVATGAGGTRTSSVPGSATAAGAAGAGSAGAAGSAGSMVGRSVTCACLLGSVALLDAGDEVLEGLVGGRLHDGDQVGRRGHPAVGQVPADPGRVGGPEPVGDGQALELGVAGQQPPDPVPGRLERHQGVLGEHG